MPKEYNIETKALHAGAVIDATTSRGVPLYRTSSYVFRDTKHAADLFSLKEPGIHLHAAHEPYPRCSRKKNDRT